MRHALGCILLPPPPPLSALRSPSFTSPHSHLPPLHIPPYLPAPYISTPKSILWAPPPRKIPDGAWTLSHASIAFSGSAANERPPRQHQSLTVPKIRSHHSERPQPALYAPSSGVRAASPVPRKGNARTSRRELSARPSLSFKELRHSLVLQPKNNNFSRP
jgi:hypothetical protein